MLALFFAPPILRVPDILAFWCPATSVFNVPRRVGLETEVVGRIPTVNLRQFRCALEARINDVSWNARLIRQRRSDRVAHLLAVPPNDTNEAGVAPTAPAMSLSSTFPNAGPCDRGSGGAGWLASSTASTVCVVRPVADTPIVDASCYDAGTELTGTMTLDVTVTKVPEVEVGNGGEKHATSKTGVLFKIRDEGRLRGRFQVATGGVRWWCGAAQTNPAFVPWGKIIEYLESQH